MDVLAPPHAVVFDMDGLLLDSERICMEIFSRVVREHGFEFDRELYGRCIGTTHAGTRKILVEGYGGGFPYEEVESVWMNRYEARVRSRPVPVKSGAREVLEKLTGLGIDRALATSTRSDVADRKLELAGLGGFFAVRVTGDQVERGKPDPEPYLEAASRLGRDVTDCWALEDSDNGVRSAHAAGLTVIQVPDLAEPAGEVRALGHRVLGSLAELVALLPEPEDVR